jgi:hypothetical protein
MFGRKHRQGPSPVPPPARLVVDEDGTRAWEKGEKVLWTVELDEEVSAQEALDEGLTVIEDLPERMPAVVSYSAIGGGNACLRPLKGESFRGFVERLRQAGEAGEHFAKTATQLELERLGVTFPGEEDAEFPETWLDGNTVWINR